MSETHTHEWVEYGVVTSWAMQYEKVWLCANCRTFKVRQNGEEFELT